MTDQEILLKLTEIFHEAFADNSIQLAPEMSASDVVGWDSMKMVSIILAVEERFAIRLSSREVDHLGNVGDLLFLIKSKIDR